MPGEGTRREGMTLEGSLTGNYLAHGRVWYPKMAKYLFHFLAGGAIVTIVTYFAGRKKSLVAAFFANLPVITLVTFLMINLQAGQQAVLAYAQGLVIMLFPWLAYIFSVILLSERMGVVPSLAIGLLLCLLLAAVIMILRS